MTERTLPPTAHLIPQGAERVFHGMIFDVYQWPQRLYDGSMATFEMLRRPDTVAVFALEDDDTVLTLDEEQPGGIHRVGGVPVGRVDPEDPTVLAAAQRELREETGVECARWRLLTVTQPEAKIEWFVHVFAACEVTARGPQHLDAGEQIRVGRTPYAQVLKGRHAGPLAPFAQPRELRRFLSSTVDGAEG